jgi:hypothetical protein
MTAPAAPASGRRASLGAAAVLVGFLLLAPPLYLLGPFALLMLLGRPRTTRELFWRWRPRECPPRWRERFPLAPR